jgi:hypothetical protein
MRILTFRRMIGIAAIGVAYAHGKRGGDASFASISDTLSYLWSSIAPRLGLDKPAQRGQARPMPARTVTPNGLAGERHPRPQGS